MSDVPVEGRITVEIRHCCTYIPDETGEQWVPAPGQGIEIASAPTVVDVPYVSGVGEIGSVLNCTMGNWTGEPSSFGYEWASEGEPNGGTGTDYVVAAGDAGKTITCSVTATNAGGSTTAPPSNGVLVVVVRSAGDAAPADDEEGVASRSGRRV